MIWLFLVLPPLMLFLGFRFLRYLANKDWENIIDMKIAEYKALSKPSRRIIDAYYELPEANRPYSNIKYVLENLDTKHGKEAVNKHFSRHHGYEGGSYFSWHPGCAANICVYGHHRIYNLISQIKSALESHEKAIRQAGIDEESIKQLTEVLRDERDLLNKTTKEIA